MATIASIGRERRQTLNAILKASRDLDTSQEALERYLKGLARRKRSFPEPQDLSRAAALYSAMVSKSRILADKIQKGFIQ